MLASRILNATVGSASEKLYVDDVFSAYLRTGTGADVTVTTGIDMTKGYMLWTKGRSGATDHAVYDSARGVTKDLVTNSTAAETTQATGLKAVSSTGYTIGSLAKMNTSSATYVDWVFRKAEKFFDVLTVSHTNGTPTNINLSSLGAVGMVIAKITGTTGDWITWHRSLTAGNNLRLNTTAGQTTTNAWLSVSGTTATLASAAPTGTYVVYGWAHDVSADGVIQCGSFTAGGAGVTTTENLGYEPQFVIIKRSTGGTDNWRMFDVQRGMPSGASSTIVLAADVSDQEQVVSPGCYPTATGFNVVGGTAGSNFIYLAIRRPNKPPTSGTQVFGTPWSNGTLQASYVFIPGSLSPDLVISKSRNLTTVGTHFHDRLRGPLLQLSATSTAAESSVASSVKAFTIRSGAGGFEIGNTSWDVINASNNFHYMLRRATGVFDIVCYTGTGVVRTVPHNLGAVPELMIVKSRSASISRWCVYAAPLGATKWLALNQTLAANTSAIYWNNTEPTSTAFTVTGDTDVGSAYTYVAYLFASLPGISKVGSYTGNGSSQTVDCGFSAGARFVLIKRTDNTGDWLVADTARGIIAGNDPGLSLNTTAAEVTTEDWLDPHTSGFIVNQVAGSNANVLNATYIYLAIA